MNRSRTIGIILIALGLIIAVIAGLWLAVSVSNGLNTTSAFTNAVIAFVPIGLLVGAGIYQFVRGSQDTEDAFDSAMRRQRELVDLLNASEQPLRMADLAAQLGVGVETIATLLNELIRLKLFSGYVNWQAREVQRITPARLRTLQTCAHCGQPLRLADHLTCPNCSVQYFLLEDQVQ